MYLDLGISQTVQSREKKIQQERQVTLTQERSARVQGGHPWRPRLPWTTAYVKLVYTPPLSVRTVLCTHKRDFATVTLIPGRCFDRGGGGGCRILQQSRGGAKFEYFSGVPWTKRKLLVWFSIILLLYISQQVFKPDRGDLLEKELLLGHIVMMVNVNKAGIDNEEGVQTVWEEGKW